MTENHFLLEYLDRIYTLVKEIITIYSMFFNFLISH